tara:strand:- start:435 stop:1169 length:735 start_codon:yes stop_codon:yes gene_type:complete
MTLATSGNLTLNQIHIEAGGSSSSACTINDTDIRGLQAGAGQTINSSSGTAIEIGDFYGATNDPRSSLTGSPSLTGTLTVAEKYAVIYIVNTQLSTRYNGYANSTINIGTDSVGNNIQPMGAWLNNSTWMGATVAGFYSSFSSSSFFGGSIPTSVSYSFVLNGAYFNSNWTSISLYHPYSNYSNPYVFTRASATYSYNSSFTYWTWTLNTYTPYNASTGPENLILGSPRINSYQTTDYQTLTIA